MVNNFDWFLKWATYTPQKVAVKDAATGKELTYGQLNSASNGIAKYLRDKYGLEKGDRVGIIAENDLTQVLLFGAAQKMGLVLVPINYRLAPEEVEYMLGDAECHLVLYGETSYDVHQIKHKATYEPIAPFIHFIDDEAPLYSEQLDEDDAIFILYTSGTTGFPKGTLYTHKMLFWNSVNTALSLIISSNTRTLNCMPLFHTGGWNVLLTPVLHHGGTIILFRKFDAATVLDAIVEEKLDLFMAVPTMLKMMAELPQFENTDISFLNYIIVGGESMPIGLIKKFHKKGVPIRQGYGLTEAGPNLTSLHQSEAERKQGSIGKPNFYVEIKIVNEEGKEAESNESGELWIGGPNVTPGYWKNAEATYEAKHEGWLKTGDVAKMDEDGFLYIVDRKKHMYISGGENVYPVEVERVLLQHEKIKEAVVFGVPHEKWGECGVALLVVNDTVTQAEILEYCRLKLAKFKIPSEIHFIESIPKNDTGKINRKKLKSDFMAKVH
ncbi:o-succinylbenzoate--CoA ligase [Flagellimonas nanhaiensis]|uniref:O-succinylbenzoate--CoA ligase n=1 Tax=Flagellimonas nanhaiensis TaxID=2292706 RepID=A0A371JSM4_9FLAO|nr:o-succinylbenzoate--CoA ligase [Allomuricauda nanhaiensis]RDY60805.1 o-succinylbenzoate--CoA ligase [Allomuricauda nanhaiensis]